MAPWSHYVKTWNNTLPNKLHFLAPVLAISAWHSSLAGFGLLLVSKVQYELFLLFQSIAEELTVKSAIIQITEVIENVYSYGIGDGSDLHVHNYWTIYFECLYVYPEKPAGVMLPSLAFRVIPRKRKTESQIGCLILSIITPLPPLASSPMSSTIDWVDKFVKEGEQIESDLHTRLWGKGEWKDPEATRQTNAVLNAWITLIYQTFKEKEQAKPRATNNEQSTRQDYDPAHVSDRLKNHKEQRGIEDTPYATLNVSQLLRWRLLLT